MGIKYILLTIKFAFSCTGDSAGSQSNDYQYPKKDCHEMFIEVAELLKEADKQWVFLEDMPGNSSESVKHAEEIYWLTTIAANYTTVYEAFCNI